jgi:hypothetical protein
MLDTGDEKTLILEKEFGGKSSLPRINLGATSEMA